MTPAPGRATSARRCGCSAPTPTWSSPRTTGPPGAPSGSRRSSTQQRDVYAYLHDQTLRRMNQGLIGTEIAEDFDAAAGAREHVERPRLLRLVQPQREGHLPALPRAGTTATRRTCGPTRRRRRRPGTSSSWAAPTRCWRRLAQSLDAGRPALDRDRRQPRRVRRPRQRRRPRAARPGPGTAGPRRRERPVAQHLPARRRGAAWADRATAAGARLAGGARGADGRAALRLDRCPHRRAAGSRCDGCASTGCSPTSTAPIAPSSPTEPSSTPTPATGSASPG